MKIFIDSADYDEIKQAYEWGVVDGVTTNPSLLKKATEKRIKAGEKLDNLKDYITNVLTLAKNTPVSLEVTETTAKGMIEQGKRLYDLFNPIANNVYIKIPINTAFDSEDNNHFNGIQAISALKAKGIPINCTLIFTPEQALLAAKAGADFVSPFAGRIDDDLRKSQGLKFDKTDYYPAGGKKVDGEVVNDNGIGSGIELVSECVEILTYYHYETQVLAASLRNPRQVREAALVGADIATLPFGVIKEMLKHHKTFEGMKNFTNDIVEEYVDLVK